MAAPPVSPEVAPMIVARVAARRQHAVHEPRQQLHGHVLEGQRRPVEQLQHPAGCGPICTSGVTAGWPKRA